VYKIPCKNCEHFGETGKPLAARVKEHRKEVDSITGIFTRAEKTRAASICNKSAITDHICNENHVIEWENAKVIDRESDKAGRLIRETIWKLRQVSLPPTAFKGKTTPEFCATFVLFCAVYAEFCATPLMGDSDICHVYTVAFWRI